MYLHRWFTALSGAALAMGILRSGSDDSGAGQAAAADTPGPTLVVEATDDFEVTGDGRHANWQRSNWTELRRRPDAAHEYTTRVKVLYSQTGLYVLMDGTDGRLTASLQADYENLWTEDVYEFFVWPDERYPVYFEYEISPLNKELPILIPNFGGDFYGWRPWHYDATRSTRKAVSITGGPQEPGAKISGWRAEVFTPYSLLAPLKNVPPQPGTRWRANFYRMDYDDGGTSSWDWAPVGESFHEYEKFGTLQFK